MSDKDRSKIKICFVNSNADCGGGEKWCYDSSLLMMNCGHEVHVATAVGGWLAKKIIEAGIPVFEFATRNLSFLNPLLLIRVRSFLKENKFDCVVMCLPTDMKVFAPVAKQLGVKRVIFSRGSDIEVRNSLLNRFLYRFCLTDVLVNSRATMANVLKNNVVDRSKLTMLYHGVDVDAYEKGESRICEIPVVGTLGRLCRQKSQWLFISMARVLKARGVRCRFVIGGAGMLDGQLKEYARKEGVDDVVDFCGYVYDAKSFHQNLDVFVLTSEWEGFGYVLAETMLCEKPVVAFSVSSNPEVVDHGKTGFLVDWCDVEAMADAVQLLIESPELRSEMGMRGRKRVQENFDIRKLSANLVDFFV